jgi:hypothetical protein
VSTLLRSNTCLNPVQITVDGPAVPFGPEKKGGLLAGFDHPDKLNLAGLLNVLDGVVCCPNRIVGMCPKSNDYCILHCRPTHLLCRPPGHASVIGPPSDWRLVWLQPRLMPCFVDAEAKQLPEVS